MTRHLAPATSSTRGRARAACPRSTVGSRTYVESGSHAKSSPSGTGQRAPGLVAGEDVRVRRAEHLLADRARDRLLHLLRGRPDVREEDVLAVRADADRLAREVDIHPAGERIRDDERRGGEVVRLHLRVDPSFEVPVPGEHGADDEVALRRPPVRSPRRAARSSRCRSCTRSRPCGTRAPRGTASAPPSRSTRSRPSIRERGSSSPTACGRGRARRPSSRGAPPRP